MTGDLDFERLSPLIEAAAAARQHAYAPYSHFAVGAAILTAEDQIFSGCNVENASYGLTLCAERNAASSAVAAGHRQWVDLVLVTHNAVTPCGACRQFLAEFNLQLRITLVHADTRNIAGSMCLADLLPHAFRDFPSSDS